MIERSGGVVVVAVLAAVVAMWAVRQAIRHGPRTGLGTALVHLGPLLALALWPPVVGVPAAVVIVVVMRLAIALGVIRVWMRQQPVTDDLDAPVPEPVQEAELALTALGFDRVAVLRDATQSAYPRSLVMRDPDGWRLVTVGWMPAAPAPITQITTPIDGGRVITTTTSLVFAVVPEAIIQALPGTSVAAAITAHDEALVLAANIGLSVDTDAVGAAVADPGDRAVRVFARMRDLLASMSTSRLTVEVAWRLALRRSKAAGPISRRPDALETLRSWAAEARAAT